MLVSCPSCSITYRVSDKLITTSNPTFRCSRCKHIFVLELESETIPQEETSPHPPETRHEEKEKSPELEFSLCSTPTDTTERKTEEDSLPTEETQPPATASLDQEPSEPPKPTSEEPFVRQEESEEATRAYLVKESAVELGPQELTSDEVWLLKLILTGEPKTPAKVDAAVKTIREFKDIRAMLRSLRHRGFVDYSDWNDVVIALPKAYQYLATYEASSETLERKASSMKFSIKGDNDVSIGAVGNNLTELKETLLSNIERMEALLLEAKPTASREAQQYEELRQMQEAKVGMLEAQLQEKEESLRMKESANRQLEESLTAKIQELEHRLTEKEGLLDKGGQEIMNARSEAEAIVLRLQALLQGNRTHLETREAELIDHTSSVAPLDRLPEGFVNLRDDLVASLNLLEKKPLENDVYLSEVGEEQNLKSMAAEIEKLRVEVRERDVLVAASEMQVRMIKQDLVEKVRDLERTKICRLETQLKILLALGINISQRH